MDDQLTSKAASSPHFFSSFNAAPLLCLNVKICTECCARFLVECSRQEALVMEMEVALWRAQDAWVGHRERERKMGGASAKSI